ncbi:MAG: hypothetical protein WCJ24_00385 [Candidatus Saccharibacteria bacterium]
MNKPTSLSTFASPEEQDAYAQSLLRVVALDYEKQRAQTPVTKHIFSKKRLIILAVSTIISILSFWVVSLAGKQSNNSSSQIINSAKTFNDPNKY